MVDVLDDLLGGKAPSKGGPDVTDDLLFPRGVLPKGQDIGAKPIEEPARLPQDAPWHSPVTGAGRTEFPESPELMGGSLDMSPGQGEFWRMFAGQMATVEPEQLADIAVKTLPGAKQTKDRHGNLMVNYRGRKFYVNKPGASRTDLLQFLGQTIAFLPAGKLATLPANVLKRLTVGAPAHALTSSGLDIAAESLGSEQGVSAGRAAVSGVAGAGAEIVSPLARKFMRFFRGSRGLVDETGQLTGRGRRMAEAAGFDPDKMGEDLSRRFAREAESATEGAAQRVRGQEFGIPMTRGQASGDFDQLAREEATRHGSFGEKAGDIMRQFDESQQAAMQGARGQIQSRVGGGETRLARPQQAGEIVGPGLSSRAATKKAAVSSAYEAASETPASISAEGVRGLWRRAAESVSDFGVDPQLHPASARGLRTLRRLESSTRRQAKGKAGVTSVALKRLETERRKLLNLERAAANPADAAAVRRIRGAFDNWMDEAVDNALFSGDDKALEAIKAARAQRREYGSLFEPTKPGDKAGKIIQNIVSEERTPEQVMNQVIGRGKLGQQDVSTDILNRIKKITGTDAEEWMALKEAGWLKLSKEIGTDTFSPTKFKNRLNDVMETNRSWMQEMYTPDELNMFERFRDEVMRTVTPEGARNPSKTAYTMGRLMREWMGRMGTMLTFSGSPLGGATFFTMKRAPEMLGTRRARKAVSGLPEPRAKMPLFQAGAVAGTRMGTEE